MTENLEHFGHPCSLPERDLVLDIYGRPACCPKCGREIYKYESASCAMCWRDLHMDCMTLTNGEYICKRCTAEQEKELSDGENLL